MFCCTFIDRLCLGVLCGVKVVSCDQCCKIRKCKLCGVCACTNGPHEETKSTVVSDVVEKKNIDSSSKSNPLRPMRDQCWDDYCAKVVLQLLVTCPNK